MSNPSGLRQQLESIADEIREHWSFVSDETFSFGRLCRLFEKRTGKSIRELGNLSSREILQTWRSIIDESTPQYVTLDQIAAGVNRKAKTLRNMLSSGKMLKPDVRGKPGQPNLWKWERVRPWAESKFNRQLPEKFPDF